MESSLSLESKEDEDMEGMENPGLWSSWSLRDSFWLESGQNKTTETNVKIISFKQEPNSSPNLK